MRSISLGVTTVLGLLAADSSVAAAAAAAAATPATFSLTDDGPVMSGFSEVMRGDGFLAVPVGTVPRSMGPKRAAEAFEDRLYNVNFFYATDVNIGVPPQRVTVLVDTGSSELWVNPDCRTAKSQQQAQQCMRFGKYDPRKSSQSNGPTGKEQLKYGDPSDQSTQTSVSIQYYTDTVSLGGASITNQTFGVVSNSRGQSQGILGLAPDPRAGFDSDTPYRLVLSSMAAEGVIASRVYSLDLRHSDSTYGAVIYGGLDKSKFIGALEKRPIVKGTKGEYRLAVELSTVGVTATTSSSFKVEGRDSSVMLDSGTTMSRMHSAVVMPILQALEAQDDGEGYFQVRCSLKTAGGSIDFGFGGKTIRVPLKDFILSLDRSSDTCYAGVVITTDQQILGDSVLRAGYFVFDWDNQEVHIAQAADCGNNDIVAVSSGKNAVPSATGNCRDSDAMFTGEGSLPTSIKGGSFPTKAYTTVHTITSCPQFDTSCRIGAVTTQVIPAATGTGGADNGGRRVAALSGLLMMIGMMTTACNVA
ncbi:hypothetical protein E4U42_001090 [Claviceps africana]|uniref:Peptidase A1 domain-containing protein n=1 Tax=Claviceps africana TaxID=83212 RepID=A0A8K0NKH4_9HYPO|nr:hypothetical protein E4U42_001090 [Claviceps africana]